MSIREVLDAARVESTNQRFQSSALAFRVHAAEDLARDVPKELTKRVKQDLESGSLRVRYEAAFGEATQAGVPHDEAVIAAVSSLLLALARESGNTLRELTEKARYEQGVAAGKSSALADLVAKLASAVGDSSSPESGDCVAPLNGNGHSDERPHLAG